MSINEIIEIGQPCKDGVQDGSLVVKVKHGKKHGNAMHVDGSLVSLSGKEFKLYAMFTSPAVIKKRQANNTDNLVLSHPAAKVAFERPSGTAWFTCQKGHNVAIERPTRLKDNWKSIPADGN